MARTPIEFADYPELLARSVEEGALKVFRDMILAARRMDALTIELPVPIAMGVLRTLGSDMPQEDHDDE